MSGASAPGDTFFHHRWPAAGRRWLDAAILVFFAWYGIYVLMLSKLFSVGVAPDWYNDLGILWDLADYTARSGHYLVGQYFFPPSNAILVHLYGLLDRDIAFRIYLVAELMAIGVTIWAWLRLAGAETHPNRALIILAAFLATHTYIHIEVRMHNANAVALGLVSLALAFPRRTMFSTGCYAFSLAVKPQGSGLVLPWMAWNRNGRWAAGALAWLVLWYGVLPAAWFGVADSVQLYREWIASLFAMATYDGRAQLSVQAGVAALGQWDIADPVVRSTAFALQAGWIAALAVFFLPALRRRLPCSGMPAACELAAILMVGLPLGNHQQPARDIALLPAMLVIAAVTFDARRSPRQRVILGAILVAIAVSTHAVPMGPVHFLLTLPVCVLALIGLAIVRAMPSDRADGAVDGSSCPVA